MTCREFVDVLMRYLERELPAPEQEAFDAHMEACPSCRTYLETYSETLRLEKLCADPDAPVPEDVPEALVKAVAEALAREKARRV